MDIIRIDNLEVYAYHGVYDEEKEKGQYFYVNAELYTNTRKAGMNDDLDASTNYGTVCDFIHDFMTKHTYDLIETVAEQLAQALLLEFKLVKSILLEIRKPHAPIEKEFESVSVEIERGWHEAFVAFGSNLGDKEKFIDEAIEALSNLPQINIVAISDKIVTEPYGNVEQDVFLNGVMKIETLLPADELLQILQKVEEHAGRERKIHWGPRTLDLDIIFYDDDIISEDDLIVPHPDMKNRDFVLKPLMQIAPYKLHPVYRKTISDMYAELMDKKQ
ncbi:2-amino-4-hydroxy-6-hydroxymethyldihydropteridine diphosphokinase [Megamonas funiformis]|jgi:dihydroneopterin aldolase/2-amino-4-hydroxy-6-hydroxymethyldihydropteridine diphosphokinase|uniref:2-amino-4-hydroxy-6- hydroxymethyldihydropteridine diphosphokinase n=1 Tax=Megamonas funiformis TaxID=437897 RepID=UPI0025979BF6|nr:2-amino-4-hydroxy-6-hydroxymethyldihydropteridine diphosphokinase [uncultured Megamonas sp.]